MVNPELIVNALNAQRVERQRQVDEAAALILKVNRVETDLGDFRRPSQILSSLIEKGVAIDMSASDLPGSNLP